LLRWKLVAKNADVSITEKAREKAATMEPVDTESGYPLVSFSVKKTMGLWGAVNFFATNPILAQFPHGFIEPKRKPA
jgi:hypothetical protein